MFFKNPKSKIKNLKSKNLTNKYTLQTEITSKETQILNKSRNKKLHTIN